MRLTDYLVHFLSISVVLASRTLPKFSIIGKKYPVEGEIWSFSKKPSGPIYRLVRPIQRGEGVIFASIGPIRSKFLFFWFFLLQSTVLRIYVASESSFDSLLLVVLF